MQDIAQCYAKAGRTSIVASECHMVRASKRFYEKSSKGEFTKDDVNVR